MSTVLFYWESSIVFVFIIYVEKQDRKEYNYEFSLFNSKYHHWKYQNRFNIQSIYLFKQKETILIHIKSNSQMINKTKAFQNKINSIEKTAKKNKYL